MNKCRLCKNNIPKWQSFCTSCGARTVWQPNTSSKSALNLKKSFKNIFVGESEDEAAWERHWQFGFSSESFVLIPPILVEDLGNLSSKNKDKIVRRCVVAADERLGNFGFGGVLEKISRNAGDADEILSLINDFRKDKENVFGEPPNILYMATPYSALNKVLNGALFLYDKAVQLEPDNPYLYDSRANAFSHLADCVLIAYGVYPEHREAHYYEKDEEKLVIYGRAKLGLTRQRELNINKIEEILWMYDVVNQDYKKTIDLNPTDTASIIRLADIEYKLGNQYEADNYFNKALAVLNKALQADSTDAYSYSERAEVFGKLGEIDLAIIDLENALKHSTDSYYIDGIKSRLDKLRKLKQATSATAIPPELHIELKPCETITPPKEIENRQMEDEPHIGKDIERTDAKKVDEAQTHITNRNFAQAEDILKDVCSRCPETYQYKYLSNGTLTIKFWDLQEFMQYIANNEEDRKKEILWQESAYPRACYYLAYVQVEKSDFQKAIESLERGRLMEPQNPKFLLELGVIYGRLKDHSKALDCYRSARIIDSITERDKAIALRGMGVQLIDLGKLEEAELVLKQSLQIEPNNSITEKELAYIAHLKST